jgi:ferredoxin
MKLRLERNECVGCGSCVALCAELFDIASDGRSSIKDVELKDVQEKELDEVSCSKDAAESCPVNCIHIEEDGKKII